MYVGKKCCKMQAVCSKKVKTYCHTLPLNFVAFHIRGCTGGYKFHFTYFAQVCPHKPLSWVTTSKRTSMKLAKVWTWKNKKKVPAPNPQVVLDPEDPNIHVLSLDQPGLIVTKKMAGECEATKWTCPNVFQLVPTFYLMPRQLHGQAPLFAPRCVKIWFRKI